MVQKSS